MGDLPSPHFRLFLFSFCVITPFSMSLLFQISLYIFSIIGIFLLGLYTIVSLVAFGCANTKAESLRPMIFCLGFLILFCTALISLILSFLGSSVSFVGVDPVYLSALISLLPISILAWLRQLSIPSMPTP